MGSQRVGQDRATFTFNYQWLGPWNSTVAPLPDFKVLSSLNASLGCAVHLLFLVPCLSLNLLWRRGMWLAVPLLAFLYTDGDSTVLLGPRQCSINTLSYFKRKTSYSSSLFIQLVLFQMQLWVRWFNRVQIYYHNFYKILKMYNHKFPNPLILFFTSTAYS